MKQMKLLLWITTVAMIAGLVYSYYQVQKPEQKTVSAYVPNQLLIKSAMRTSVSSSQKNYILRRFAREIKSIQYIAFAGVESIETYPGVDLLQLRNRLLEESWVEKVYFNHLYRTCEKVPQDRYFQYQYALKNTGQFVLEGGATDNYHGASGADIKATEAWDFSTGSENEVIVAVIDTGVARNHEDLKNQLSSGINILDETQLPEDDNGHGTFIASIIAAETNNSVGIAGVSWKAKIMPIKALNGEGVGDSLSIFAAIIYAADHGAKVINMSFGSASLEGSIVEDACKHAFVDKQCILVSAAGNGGLDQVNFPAAYDKYCLAVAATDADDKWVKFSNYGPQIDVAAPGVYIWGAFFDPTKPAELRGYKVSTLSPFSDTIMGTSCSAAYVSGAIALLCSMKPGLTADQVMNLVRYTADDVNKDTGNLEGPDNYIGYGRLNLRRLLGPYPLIKKSNDQSPQS